MMRVCSVLFLCLLTFRFSEPKAAARDACSYKSPEEYHCSDICVPFHNNDLPWLDVSHAKDCVEILVDGLPEVNKYLLVWIQIKLECRGYIMHEFAIQALDNNGFPIGSWYGVGSRTLEEICPSDKELLSLPAITLGRCQGTTSLDDRRLKERSFPPTYAIFRQSQSKFFSRLGMLFEYFGNTPLDVTFIAEVVGNDPSNVKFISDQTGPFYVRKLQFRKNRLNYRAVSNPEPTVTPSKCYIPGRFGSSTDRTQMFAAFDPPSLISVPRNPKYMDELAKLFPFNPTWIPNKLTTSPPGTKTKRPPIIVPGKEHPTDPNTTPNPRIQEDIRKQEKDIYKRCELTKKCFASAVMNNVRPQSGLAGLDPCIRASDCNVMVSYGNADIFDIPENFVYLEIVGRSNFWVAIGFSQDQKMGSDFVIECARESQGPVVRTSWNEGDSNLPMPEPQYKDFVRLYQSGFSDGNTFCKFAIKDVVFYEHPDKSVSTFRLERSLYYVLMAVGVSQPPEGRVNYHGHDNRWVTSFKVAIGTRFSPKPWQQNLIYWHGQLMYISFLFIFPIATFLGRYCKETFVNTTYFGLRKWIFWHILLHFAGIIVVFLGHLTLTFANKGWTRLGSNQTNYHFWSAIIAAAFYFFNTFMGLLNFGRQAPGQTNCNGCQWFHALIGHFTYLVSLACLARSNRVLYSYLPCSASSVITVWVWMYVLFNIIMSYQTCWVDWLRGEHTVTYAIGPLELLVQPYSKPDEVAPGSNIRLYVLCIYIFASSVITLAASLILWVGSTENACYKEDYFLELT